MTEPVEEQFTYQQWVCRGPAQVKVKETKKRKGKPDQVIEVEKPGYIFHQVIDGKADLVHSYSFAASKGERYLVGYVYSVKMSTDGKSFWHFFQPVELYADAQQVMIWQAEHETVQLTKRATDLKARMDADIKKKTSLKYALRPLEPLRRLYRTLPANQRAALVNIVLSYLLEEE